MKIKLKTLFLGVIFLSTTLQSAHAEFILADEAYETMEASFKFNKNILSRIHNTTDRSIDVTVSYSLTRNFGERYTGSETVNIPRNKIAYFCPDVWKVIEQDYVKVTPQPPGSEEPVVSVPNPLTHYQLDKVIERGSGATYDCCEPVKDCPEDLSFCHVDFSSSPLISEPRIRHMLKDILDIELPSPPLKDYVAPTKVLPKPRARYH